MPGPTKPIVGRFERAIDFALSVDFALFETRARPRTSLADLIMFKQSV